VTEPARLEGGNTGGAVLVDGTVRRAAGPWTPAVHALLHHLAAKGFAGAPVPDGIDDQGREVLSYLPGDTVGSRRPWPAWTHTDATLVEVAHWLRDLHQAVADFRPPADAVWREGGSWAEGLVVGHNDAAPYNAAWEGRLVGFFDWDFAAPVTREWDLAFTAFAWVPLHARAVVEAEGFNAFDDRRRRLELFLGAYGWTGEVRDFIDIVRARVTASAEGIRRTAERGDAAYQTMLRNGVDRLLLRAVAEMAEILE
jgi:hypothetical protein